MSPTSSFVSPTVPFSLRVPGHIASRIAARPMIALPPLNFPHADDPTTSVHLLNLTLSKVTQVFHFCGPSIAVAVVLE